MSPRRKPGWHADCAVVCDVLQIGCAMFDRKRILIIFALALMMFGLSILQFYVMDAHLNIDVSINNALLGISIAAIFAGGMMIVFLYD